MNRVDRLVAILTTIQSKRFVTLEYIADKYQISERTVYRDIKALGEIGVPVSFENNKGYSIPKEYFLPPVTLTSEEANALILVAKLSERYTDRTIQKNVANALDKIKSVLRTVEKEKAHQLEDRIGVFTAANAETKDYLTEIQNSILNRQILDIEYVNNNEEKSSRLVEPIGLKFYSNQWHLIAWCWLRNEYRDFKVLRVQSLKNTMKPFKKKEHVSLEEYVQSLV
ncbi:MAG: WYL domain-containing protein [Bacteroidetes bacterium]|nr:WYL domain-containing protein [Bacteroidota bacterium]